MNPDNHTWDLLVGALKGTLGEAEQREFDRWAAEAENRRFYNNLTRVWREIQQRAAAYEPDRDRLWRQLQQRIGTYEIPHADQLPKRRRSHLLQMAIAVAAAVAVTLFATRADLSAPPQRRRNSGSAPSKASRRPGWPTARRSGSTADRRSPTTPVSSPGNAA